MYRNGYTSFRRKTISSLSLLWMMQSAGAQNITCFESGTVADCSTFVSSFCNFVSATTTTCGFTDSISRCFTISDDVKCDLTAWHAIDNDADTPSGESCQNIAGDVIDLCPMGGSGKASTGTFVFTVDPNDGTCGDTSTLPEI